MELDYVCLEVVMGMEEIKKQEENEMEDGFGTHGWMDCR